MPAAEHAARRAGRPATGASRPAFRRGAPHRTRRRGGRPPGVACIAGCGGRRARRPARCCAARSRRRADPRTPGDSGYGFRHALLAEAIYDDLLPGERVRIHAAYATALQKAVDGTAAELARHARESHDLSTAFAASIRAGDEAMTVGAPQEALRHYEVALELLPAVPEDDRVDEPQLAVAAADAAVAAGHPYRAVHLTREALDQYPDDGDPRLRAELLYGLATASVADDGDFEVFTATSEALRLVPADPPSTFRTRIASLHAHAAMALDRLDDAERWASEAVEAAIALGHPEAAADAHTTLAILHRRAGEPA